MTEPRREPPTDLQLEALVRHLAKAHLEIERGVRDPTQLTRLMSPESEAFWVQTRPRGATLPGGPARDRDIGPVHLRRDHDGHVFAAVTTPTVPGRRGALTFVLHAATAEVTIRQATRLHTGLNYGRSVADTTDRPHHRLGRALEEHRLVAAALEAAKMPAFRPSGAARPDADTWTTLLHRLDDEITTLMKTDLQRHFHTEPRRRA
jgi:hypothetical protein